MPKILERYYPPTEANDNVYFMRRVGFEYVPVRFVMVEVPA